MPSRYLPSQRTQTGTHATDALRDQFLRELARDAEALLGQLSQRFAQDAQSQAAQLSQALLGSGGDLTSGGTGQLSGLLSLGTRLLVPKPKTSESTVETQRSQAQGSSFRLSQTQSLAEAATALAKGEKNQ